jgi:hypothetical protein
VLAAIITLLEAVLAAAELDLAAGRPQRSREVTRVCSREATRT